MPLLYIDINETKPPAGGAAEEASSVGATKFPRDRTPKKLKQFAVMEANDATREEKLKEIFGIDMATASAREINNADATMSRWRRHPAYDIAWREEASTWDFRDYSKARSVLRKGMRQESDPWLAMNSAVNTLSATGKRIFKDEDSEITVKIEGMPDIGTPEDDG